MCSATSRVLVHSSIAKAFHQQLKRRAEEIKICDPNEPECRLGPVVNQAQYDKILTFIAVSMQTYTLGLLECSCLSRSPCLNMIQYCRDCDGSSPYTVARSVAASIKDVTLSVSKSCCVPSRGLMSLSCRYLRVHGELQAHLSREIVACLCSISRQIIRM